jgi:RNA polymerase-binding transcription factor DksA
VIEVKERLSVRAQLEARLGLLKSRLKEIQRLLREHEDDDLDEQIADLDDSDVLERLEHASRNEVLLIRTALRMMDEGMYGRCAVCGEEIGMRRLRALPAATTCIECATSAPTRRFAV